MLSLFLLCALIRTLIGLSPFLAPTLLTRLLGFPLSEATTSAIVFARLFGVRDIGLGAVILYGTGHPELHLSIILLNGLTDAGDLLSFLLGIRVKPELSRPLGLCAIVAGGAILLWGAMALVLTLGHPGLP